MQQRSRTKVLVTSAVLATLAMIFTYVETLIPVSIGIPGVKLGLANLVIVIALYSLDFRHAFAINMIRILIVALLFTGVFAGIYSFAGGLLSILVMGLLKKTDMFSMIGVSMAGGVAHNTGQLIIAAIMVENINMFLYFPVLLFTGLASGIMIGIASYILLERIPKGLFD